jgi:uncharacterized membrane protein YgcG
MKAFKKIIVAACLITTGSVFAQTKPDSLGLPGDNFDLPGALETFKKSNNLEAFEKAINSNDNEINNLDLNGDGEVDYVKVVDNKEGEAHTIVLQTAVTKSEIQDIAVIVIEKTKDDNAHIQIVGDEELYGKDYIVEPKDGKTVSAEKLKSDTETDDVYKGKSDQGNFNNNNNSNSDYNNNSNVVVNVWAWPSVQYIYGPTYVVYASPWYWGYYPGWWTPWYPVYWRNHYWRAQHYHHHYHHCNYYRSPNVHKGYYGRRMSAETVRQHKRTGYYNEKQIAYKDNVKPGRKYNSLPANPEKKNTKRVGNEENMNQPKKGNRSEQINNQPKTGKNEKNDQPNEINSQPKKNTQPVKRHEQQTAPVKKNPGMSTPQNNVPKQQGGGRNTGGGGGKNVGNTSGGGNNGGGGRNTGGGGGRNQK